MSALPDNSDRVSPASSEDSELRGLSLPFHSYPQDSPGNVLGDSGTLFIPKLNDFDSPVANIGNVRLRMRRGPLKEELFADITIAPYHLDPYGQAQVQLPQPAAAVPPKSAESPLPQTTLLRAPLSPISSTSSSTNAPFEIDSDATRKYILACLEQDPQEQPPPASVELFADVTIAPYHLDPYRQAQVQLPQPAAAVPPKSAEPPLPQTTLLRAPLSPISSTSSTTNAPFEIDSDATREYILARLEQDPQEQPPPTPVVFSNSVNGTDNHLSLKNDLDTREPAQAARHKLRTRDRFRLLRCACGFLRVPRHQLWFSPCASSSGSS